MTLAREVTWVPLPGGTCRCGDEGRCIPAPDLLWTQTPVTPGRIEGPGGESGSRPPSTASFPPTSTWSRTTSSSVLGAPSGSARSLAAMLQEFERVGVPGKMLFVAQPLYISLLDGWLQQSRVRTITDPHDRPAAAAVLGSWGRP